MNSGWWIRLHPAPRLVLFLVFCLRAALERDWWPQVLLFGGLSLLWLACANNGSGRLIVWFHALGLPATILLFIAIGCEQFGFHREALAWGVIEAIRYALRVESVLLANLVFINLTSARDLFALFPRRWMPAPVAILLATAVRFVPLSLDEARRICNVQRCRGLRLRPWAPKSWLPVLIPLFVSQMCRAHDTAVMLVVRRISLLPEETRRPWRLADGMILALALLLGIQILL